MTPMVTETHWNASEFLSAGGIDDRHKTPRYVSSRLFVSFGPKFLSFLDTGYDL